MKKSLFLMLCLSATTLLFGQKASIDLSFTAVSGTQYQQLDSIKITNLDQGADTCLYWNDTVLTLTFNVVGIGENTTGDAKIMVDFPHSNGSNFLLQVFNPAHDNGMLSVYDCMGRECAKVSLDRGRGWYSFRMAAGRASLYFVSLFVRGGKETVKLINTGHSSQTNCHLTEFSFTPSGTGDLKSQILTGFPFSPGDSLQYKGYANNQEVMINDNPSTSENYTFQFQGPCQGVTAFTYGGQVYNTVEIGTQCWMKENLNIGVMVNSLSTGSSHSDCSNNGIIEKYCYNNDTANCAIYGGLYDWDEMMNYSTTPGIQGICPAGWHLPTDLEWCTLTIYLDSTVNCNTYGYSGTNAGAKLKESGTAHWSSLNTGATNESGFTALGAGYRHFNGDFGNLTLNTNFWTSSESAAMLGIARGLNSSSSSVNRNDYDEALGVSVRCLRNN
ncbi:MAG TPA: FISUMP domain-containing protein [Bacteroidales bacterium]|nr:FISUMP domain-containing protein [Bacteroidales bacterium]HSA43760.1 FISUMP domain-containing protein [Bacteroidales bacterium]